MQAIAAGIAGLFPAAPAALAGDFDSARACLDARIAANEPVADCVQETQTACLSFEAPSLAGADCFRRAKDRWGGLIAQRMDQIRDGAREEVAAIAAIEVKYDLKGNLMQCDRMEELSLVQQDPGEATVYARLRCEATAVGLAYAKLYYQSSRID